MKDKLSRRELIGAAAAVVAMGATGAARASATKFKFRWSHFQPIGSIVDITTKAIVREVEAKTNGRITFEIFPAGQLGDWTDVYEQVMRGAVDFATQPVASSYDPRLQVRALPYSVMNYKEAETAYFGKDPYLFDLMSQLMEKGGLTALGVVAQGFGGAGYRHPPAGDVFDLSVDRRKLKMRFPPGNQAWQYMVSALGYSPTPVNWSELYLALQTGLVDAQVGGQPYSTWSSFRDVTKCWAQFNTHFQNAFIFGNSSTWGKIPVADQAIIRETSVKHALASLELARGGDKKYMDLMSGAGITVLIPSEEQLAKVASAVREKVWPVMDDVIGKKIMDVMRKKAGLG